MRQDHHGGVSGCHHGTAAHVADQYAGPESHRFVQHGANVAKAEFEQNAPLSRRTDWCGSSSKAYISITVGLHCTNSGPSLASIRC